MNLSKPPAKCEVCIAEPVTGSAEPTINLHKPAAYCTIAFYLLPQNLHESGQASSETRGLPCGSYYRIRGTYNNSAQARGDMHSRSLTGSAEPAYICTSLKQKAIFPCGTCYRFRGTYNKSAQVSSEMLTPSFTSVAEPVIGSGGTYINLHTSQAKCTVCRAPLSSIKILLLEQGRP